MSLNASSAPAPKGGSPIADLSYRGYDGPLRARTFRWWTIAWYGIQALPKKPIFWIWVALGLFPYLFQGLMLFTRHVTQGMNPFDTGEVHYTEPFYNALSGQGFFLFLIALLAGSGSIAADLRANALQVYLSKPITKSDYLIGKWMGIALPVYLSAVVPALVFYFYCLFSYLHDGFWADDPYLLLRVFAVAAVPAILHASLLVGFSAWSRSTFMAGAFYAAFYFITGVLANIVWRFKYAIPHHFDPNRGLLVQHLSLQGIILGLAQNLYHVSLHPTIFRKHENQIQNITIPPPPFVLLLGVAVVLCVIGIAAARMRVRAVEVVRG